MKNVVVSIFSVFAVTCAVVASPSDSMLSAAQFPKNADDLTFSQRMDLLTDGYEAFDTVFDSNGVCIKNCPYVGMTIQEFNNRMDAAAQQVQQDLAELDLQNPIQGTVSASENGAITDNAMSDNMEQQFAEKSYNQNSQVPDRILDGLRAYNQRSTSGKKIPITCPLGNNSIRVSDEMRCRNKRTRRNHNGIDLSVPTGTPIYAAADGRVVIRKNNPGGYGYYLSIQHDKGYYTVYGHLSKWLVSDGQTVRAGQEIAKSGNTGRSTGAHLHFEVLKGAPLVKDLGGVPVNPRTITKCTWNPKNNSSNTGNNRC